MIAFVVGLMAGIATGLGLAVQTQAALGTGPCIALGITSGLVTMVMTGLVIAKSLHKLLR